MAASKKAIAHLQTTAIRSDGSPGVDVIVAITHVTLLEDKQLARACPQIDLILGGHDHMPITAQEGSTLIVKCGQNAYWLGKIDMFVTATTTTSSSITSTNTATTAAAAPTPPASSNRKVSVTYQWSYIANRKQKPDPDCIARLAKYLPPPTSSTANKQADEAPPQVLMRFTGALDSRTSQSRTRECTLGNVVADAQRWYWGADIGLINGGFLRGDRLYPVPYDFTSADREREVPFPSPSIVVDILGRDFLVGLEQACSALPAPLGGFPQLSGMKITVDLSRPVGSRIIKARVSKLAHLSKRAELPYTTVSDFKSGSITAGSKPSPPGAPVVAPTDRPVPFPPNEPDTDFVGFEPDRVYRVAMTKFLYGGGDGCLGYSNGYRLATVEQEIKVAAVFTAYLLLQSSGGSKKTLTPAIEQRVDIIDPSL